LNTIRPSLEDRDSPNASFDHQMISTVFDTSWLSPITSRILHSPGYPGRYTVPFRSSSYRTLSQCPRAGRTRVITFTEAGPRRSSRTTTAAPSAVTNGLGSFARNSPAVDGRPAAPQRAPDRRVLSGRARRPLARPRKWRVCWKRKPNARARAVSAELFPLGIETADFSMCVGNLGH
jgi:hypothetical protein